MTIVHERAAALEFPDTGEHVDFVRLNDLLHDETLWEADAIVGDVNCLLQGVSRSRTNVERIRDMAAAAQSRLALAYIARDNDLRDRRYIGMGTVSWTVYSTGRRAEIVHWEVHADYHNRGIGDRLLDMLEEEAHTARCVSIDIQLSPNDTKAHSRFIARGYAKYQGGTYRKPLA